MKVRTPSKRALWRRCCLRSISPLEQHHRTSELMLNHDQAPGTFRDLILFSVVLGPAGLGCHPRGDSPDVCKFEIDF